MTDGLTAGYTGDDGLRFEVTFADAAQRAAEWRLENEHAVGPSVPLEVPLESIGLSGSVRAYAEANLPFPSWWNPGPKPHGFSYYSTAPPDPDEMAVLSGGCAELVAEYGSAVGLWKNHSLPRVKQACARLQEADVDTPYSLLAETAMYAQQCTMISAFIASNDLQLVVAVLTPIVGNRAELVASSLAQGYENATMTANQDLWVVARSAPEPVVEFLRGQEPSSALAAVEAQGEHPEFFAAVNGFTASPRGWRTETWSVASPAWREKGDGFWHQLARLVGDASSPSEATRRGAQRRQALLAELLEQIDDEAESARLQRRADRLGTYVAVREERAEWQLVATGSLRHAFLRRGTHLADRDVIADPLDVLFLTPDEYDSPPDDARELVTERRAEFDLWALRQPPLVIGGPSSDVSVAPSTGPLPGTGVSSGTVTATARVITDLAEADRFQPGDVLVCVMTSPPWTPLFGDAAAVVTETGDIQSHPSIAAREYGIPCVVGVARATTLIADGSTITVDGDAGTVSTASAR